MKVQFNKRQRKYIKRMVSLQLAALEAIIKEECEDDITLHCLNLGVTKKRFFSMVANNIDDYAHVYEHPDDLFSLPDQELSMVKHIMIAEEVKMPEKVRKEIWRKMLVFEQLNFNPN